ncbi:MAG: DUF5765 domain-containing protein [Pseudomonadota bacterium]
MCWSETASVAMVGIGGAATALAIVRDEPRAIWLTLGYFTAMEGLQAVGYGVVDACGTPANRAVTFLSYLHIAAQPFFINAFAMALVGGAVSTAMRRGVWLGCAISMLVMLAQLPPIDALGRCRPGDPLCGAELCLVSGEWHIAWSIPYNGLLHPLEDALGTSAGFPSYMLAAFGLPLLYGAWRFVLFHALVGPVLAMILTDDPQEFPAVWCLFSVGIVLIALSPQIRRPFENSGLPHWPRPG